MAQTRSGGLRSFSSAVFLTSALACGAARADEAPAPEPSESPNFATSHRAWYGYQTLLFDAAATGLFFAETSGVGSTRAMFVSSAATYAIGGPLVHALHGRFRVAGIDLALRVGAPLVCGAIGAASGYAIGALVGASNTSDVFVVNPAKVLSIVLGIAGIGVGVVGGMVTDAAVLARAPIATDSLARSTEVNWAPQVALLRGGGAFGAGGTF